MTTIIHTGRKQSAQAGKLLSPSEKTLRALEILRDAGQAGIDCFSFGHGLWPERKNRIASGKGGGDYAAQMMLGRLRKQGFARVNNGDGSSRWALTAKGSLALNPSESPWTQAQRRAEDQKRGQRKTRRTP